MRCPYTAILQLRELDPSLARGVLPLLFRVHRGVWDVEVSPDDALVTVCFDGQLTGVAEIVRTLEDAGSVVASVAQRSLSPVTASPDHRPLEAAWASASAVR
jgi:copper chaperone CopZ